MALSINTNIAALKAQGNLSKSSHALSTSLQRLSSGLRINSAKDDAAGLQISNRLTNQINGTSVAMRNANAGISMAQTAEGALQESTEILQRIRVLALQSANGSNGPEERKALNAEVTALKYEMDRIANTTSFGGKKLLDGSSGTTLLQVGSGANETIKMKISEMSTKGLQVTDQHATFQGYTIKGELNPAEWKQGDATTPSTGVIVYKEFRISIEGKEIILPIHHRQAYKEPNGELPFPEGAIITAPVDYEKNPAWKQISTMVVNTINKSGIDIKAALDEETKEIRISSDAYDLKSISIENTTGEIVLDKQSLNSALDVSTQALSQKSILAVDEALQAVDSQRASLGAVQNSLEHTISNLQNIRENVSAARGRIMDTDYAAETAILSKNQIMQQAATAMLAQANQLPETVLSLLK